MLEWWLVFVGLNFHSCHSAVLPFCHSAILPFCHSAILPFCHLLRVQHKRDNSLRGFWPLPSDSEWPIGEMAERADGGREPHSSTLFSIFCHERFLSSLPFLLSFSLEGRREFVTSFFLNLACWCWCVGVGIGVLVLALVCWCWHWCVGVGIDVMMAFSI